MKPRWAIVAVCVGLVGCFGPRARFQSAEENENKGPEVRTIGDITFLESQQEMSVEGVGLAVHLNGKGGGAPPAGPQREMLEKDLLRRGIRKPQTVLESRDCAMVILRAKIHAGVRKNDPIDIEVSLPDGSRCESLRGGYLVSCELFNYSSIKELNPNHQGADRSLKGYPLVKAEGAIITGVTGKVGRAAGERGASPETYRNEEESHKAGSVWSGGKCQIDPPLLLSLNEGQRSARFSAHVADRINQTFPGMNFGRDGLAVARNQALVALGVPLQYRHNIAHYLRVVRAIPLERNPPMDSPYRRQLANQLLDPAKCLSAALRLEALGEDSVPALRAALAAPLPLSRFAAAQALTYLRKRDGVDELARLAVEQPALRGLCLTALGSLDESICHVKLADLMSHQDPTLRYGAFYALRVLDDRAAEVPGEHCKDAYWVHQVATDSTPMIHCLTSRRAEIVLFGKGPSLLPGERLSFGEFTIAADAGADLCTLKLFSLKEKAMVEKKCSPAMSEILKTLAEMGGTYVDAVDLLRKASVNGRLNCQLHENALPRVADPGLLTRAAKDDPALRTIPAASATLFDGGQ